MIVIGRIEKVRSVRMPMLDVIYTLASIALVGQHLMLGV
jgi:hypothetical protein